MQPRKHEDTKLILIPYLPSRFVFELDDKRAIADAVERGLAGPAPSEFPREAEGEDRGR